MFNFFYIIIYNFKDRGIIFNYHIITIFIAFILYILTLLPILYKHDS